LRDSITIALKRKLHRCVRLIFCDSSKIILDGLLLNHGPEAYLLDVAGHRS